MPFEDLGVDFTEVKPCREYWYFLVLVCTYSGWVEAYRLQHRESTRGSKGPFKRNYPQIWAPPFYQIINGPAIVVEIV
jgi:hypothetical protein